MFALQTQLSRSGYSPLHILFHWPADDAYEPGSRSRLRTLAQALVPSCDRWETAELSWDPKDHSMVQILSSIRGRLPLLKRLEIFSDECNAVDATDVFASAPSLREVILTDSEYDLPSAPISAPWAQITCLRVKFTFSYLLKILRASPNLEECGLSLVEGSRAPSVPNTWPTSRACANYAGPLDNVLPFISRVRCRLAGLSAHHRYHSASLILLLKALPTLSSLSVLSFDMNNYPLLTALTSCDSLPVICPDLQPLSLSIDVPTRTTTLPGMLESRWRTSPLESVAVFDYSIDALPDRLQALKDQGLNIVLNSSVDLDPDMRMPGWA
ncbi:hypothetical protein B0H16DRAFT_1898596 [Mycena metata]|uniref:F-box protein n=1 Tax=Mycena metata TaxID=1033252 RepID=A0AAD7H9P9_9AGAR|nr:hypothetical protein B0H16DRAFT_1898596 [Mycena metata]